MAVQCTRHCKSLLSAVVSGTRERIVTAPSSAVLSSKSPQIHVSRMLPSVCTRAIYSTSSCGDTDCNNNPGQFSYKNSYCWNSSKQNAKTFAPSYLTRHYSSDADTSNEFEEDFSRGYGGPLRTPVIDWRDRFVVNYKTMEKLVNQQDSQVIDVREPFEIESAGCIENSINISFVHFRTALLMSPDEFSKKFGTKKPSKEDDNIVLIDLRGNRSEGALRICHELGFTKVKRFPGGFKEWAAKNELPIPPTYYEHGIPRDHWTNLKYDDLRMMIKRDNVYVVDVREPWEVVEQGSITSALNIPMGYLEYALNMDEADFEKQYQRRKPGKMDDIGFISWKGLRSAGCQLLALELGYAKACHFRGGMDKFNLKKKEAERPWARNFPLPKLEESN